jgi:hypothetical protein
MAIKVGGTEVIDNSRNFINLIAVDGNYSLVQAQDSTQTLTGSSTYNLNLANKVQFITLGGTWTCQYINSRSGGDQLQLFVDTTDQLYDINFTNVSGQSEWIFVNDTEPTWTDARYWQITITCWDSIIHSVSATSWGS